MVMPLNAKNTVNTWTDLSGFKALDAEAQADPNATLPVVAKQFESIMTKMMLDSMRDTVGEDPETGSSTGDQWQDMYDQQLAIQLSNGHGLGVAAMLVKQLEGSLPHDSSTSETVTGADKALAASADDSWRSRINSFASKVRSVTAAALKEIPQNAQEFVNQFAPYAKEAADRMGVSVRAVLAQVALETHWGQHMPKDGQGNSSFNLFGMKAGSAWGGPTVVVPTTEVENGYSVRVNAAFRAYDSPAGSFSDYADELTGDPRYRGALHHGDDVEKFANGLMRGGYATDPYYAQKLTEIANSPQMLDALNALKNVASQD